MNKDIKILVAGASGMVGSAIVRRLRERGYNNLLTPSRKDVNFTEQVATRMYIARQRPEYIFLCAGKVGGILANSTYPAEFIYENTMIYTNIIHAAQREDVQRLMFFGSGCIYPKFAKNPITEDMLLTGELEPSNAPLAIAKIAAIKMCEAYNEQYGREYTTVMPTNLYGPGDNYDLETSHVIPALMRKAYEAKLNGTDFVVWGDGTARRDFMHVGDCAEACVMIFENGGAINERVINISSGRDTAIRLVAHIIAKIAGLQGSRVVFDNSKMNGTPQKLLSDRIMKEALEWFPETSLGQGLEETYKARFG